MYDTIDLEKEIVRENTAFRVSEQTHLDAQAKLDVEKAKIQGAVADAYKAGVMDELGFDYQLAETRRIRKEREDFAALPQNRIMSTDAIKAVCIKFGLRFLPTRLYRGALDTGIGPAVENVKSLLGGKLPTFNCELLDGGDRAVPLDAQKARFAIMAPAGEFELKPSPRDPLLFLRLSGLKWFLVHKWGDDLRTGDLRKDETSSANWNSEFSAANRFITTPLSLSDLYVLNNAARNQGQIFQRESVTNYITSGISSLFTGIGNAP